MARFPHAPFPLTGQTLSLLGGAGFVGHALAARLGARGARVLIPTRRPEQVRELKLIPGVQLIEADVFDPATLERLCQSSSAVINLVGILNERGHDGSGFRRAHVELTERVIAACQSAGTPRLLHMSALNADEQGPSHYLRTKGEAERKVHAAASNGKLAVVSFRPSVIFGPGDSFLNRFAGLIRRMPGVFPLARADARFAPVYVGDVVAAFLHALETRELDGQALDLCGPRDYTLGELVTYTAQLIDHPLTVLPLPDWAARMQARVMEYLPGKPFSRDNLASLSLPSVCPEACPRQPTALEAIAPRYLRR
ncbi:MAG: complex I NDUFA9 subunit family protein [Halothiobacillaceae bacterium]|jgi:NADH dehydrogenase|nr:complex I NDUFA9 subunit family protein [Halothiobacillaceae bacterium]